MTWRRKKDRQPKEEPVREGEQATEKRNHGRDQANESGNSYSTLARAPCSARNTRARWLRSAGLDTTFIAREPTIFHSAGRRFGFTTTTGRFLESNPCSRSGASDNRSGDAQCTKRAGIDFGSERRNGSRAGFDAQHPGPNGARISRPGPNYFGLHAFQSTAQDRDGASKFADPRDDLHSSTVIEPIQL
jgi:hypothetical protein